MVSGIPGNYLQNGNNINNYLQYSQAMQNNFMNRLATMEQALGYGAYAGNLPCMANGYKMDMGYGSSPLTMNQMANYYNTPAFKGAADYIANQNPQTGTLSAGMNNAQANASNSTNFGGLTNQQLSAIASDYADSMTPSESFISATLGGVAFGAINNPRLFAHPINTFRATKATHEAFKNCKVEGTELYKLWHAKETNGLMQDAYAAMNKLEARQHSKLGLFRKQYSETDYKKLKDLMTKALESGNEQKIADATAQLKHAYVTDGKVVQGWEKVKGWFSSPKATNTATNAAAGVQKSEGFLGKIKSFFTPSGVPTVADKLKETKEISKISGELLERSHGLSFKQALSKGGGIGGGIFFAGVEILTNIPKMITAFGKDKETGMKQVGQTTVKAAGNAAGWALGEAAAIWGMGKAGAAIGTAFGPGVGTIIGAVAGVVGGTLGMWLAGKITNKIVGKDVADKVEAEQLAQTPEGQQQLVQYILTKAQKGEKMTPEAQAAVVQIINNSAA